MIYAIKWAYDVNGLRDPTGPWCRNVLESAKRVAKPTRNPKQPLTPEMLRKIYALIGGRNANLLELVA